MSQFGERGEEVEEKCRYAKYKAADIIKCLKAGVRPEPGPPGGSEPASPATPDIPDATALPPPVAPPAYDELPPAGKPSAPSPPAFQPPVAQPPRRQWTPQAPPPVQSSGRQPTKQQFADAVECCRFAIAACDARDAGLALERLKRAFEALS